MKTPFWDPGATGTNDPTDGEIYSSNVWDTGWIGDQQLPGIVRMQAAPARKIDKGNGAGQDGGRTRVQGHPPTDVTITIQIWRPAQQEALDRVIDEIWQPDAKKGAKPYAITYPTLARVGIRAIIVGSVPTAVLNQDLTTTWTVKGVEYRPPSKKKVTTTPKGTAKVAPEFQRAPKPKGDETHSPCAPRAASPQASYTAANSPNRPSPSTTDRNP